MKELTEEGRITVEKINMLIRAEPELGKYISDGYHTFEELYEHRCQLWITLCKVLQSYANDRSNSETALWKSKAHSDGKQWDGWFILGNGYLQGYQATYHLPMKYWDELSSIQTLEKAPQYDGHTSEDVLRILKLIGQ